MRVITTLSNVVGALCIIGIAILIIPMIWEIYPPGEAVGKLLASLATLYVCMLLIGGTDQTRNRK